MAEVAPTMIYAVALETAAPVERLDADRQDMLAEVRAESEAFIAGLALRPIALRQAH